MWGSSFSAGHAFVVAAIDRRVKAVVGQAPFISGLREFQGLIRLDMEDGNHAAFAADRGPAPEAKRRIHPLVSPDPLAVAGLPMAEAHEYFYGPGGVVERDPGFPNEITLRSVEHLYGYAPGWYLPRIAPTPLLMVVALEDRRHPERFVPAGVRVRGATEEARHHPGWTLRHVYRSGRRHRAAGGSRLVRRAPDLTGAVESRRYLSAARFGAMTVWINRRDEADVASDLAESARSGGALAGVKLAVKDNVDVAGLPTTAACPEFAYRPDRDAASVAALRAAGAVVVGKTNLDQFATGLVGTRSPHGAVPDSRRPDHISGGSSSGSAVAVATGEADIAIGTDTAGSGRVPAGLQGIVGIKPTVGVVSTDGVVPACESYDCVTIFARDLELANRAMGVMAAGAPQRPWPADAKLAAPPSPVVAVPAELPELDGVWRAAFDAAVAALTDAGARIVTVDLAPFLAAAKLLYDGALVSERYAAVGEFIDGHPDAAIDPTVGRIITGARDIPAHRLVRDRREVQRLRAAAHGVARRRRRVDGADGADAPDASTRSPPIPSG